MAGTHDNKITRMSNNMGENKNRIMWASFKQTFQEKSYTTIFKLIVQENIVFLLR